MQEFFSRHFWEGKGGEDLCVVSIYKYVRSKMCFYMYVVI